MLSGGLGGLPVFDTYSVGGQGVIAVIDELVKASFGQSNDSTTITQDVWNAMAAQIAEEASKEYVGDYLSKGVNYFAQWSLSEADQDLQSDQTISDSSTDTVMPQFSFDYALTKASVAFSYNPYTHRVVAIIASDRDPGMMYVIDYQADSTGNQVYGTQATLTPYGATQTSASLRSSRARGMAIPSTSGRRPIVPTVNLQRGLVSRPHTH